MNLSVVLSATTVMMECIMEIGFWIVWRRVTWGVTVMIMIMQITPIIHHLGMEYMVIIIATAGIIPLPPVDCTSI